KRATKLTTGYWQLSLDSQPRHPPSRAVYLVADVERDQQRGHGFHDARVLQLAAIDGAHSGNFRRQLRRNLPRAIVVAAYDDVAIHRLVALQHRCRKAVKRPGDG